MRRAFFPLLAALAGAACGSSQPSAPVTAGDGGVPDSGPKPCLDEWTVSWPASGVADPGVEFHALVAGKVLFYASDASDLLSVDGVSSVGERIVDACGNDALPSRRVANQYYFDENEALRAAYVADPRSATWNGIALPIPRPEGAIVEFRADGSLLGARAVSYLDHWTLTYPWGGRLEVTSKSSTAGSTPHFRLVEPNGIARWEVDSPLIAKSTATGTTAVAFGPSFAIAPFSAPASGPDGTSKYRFDAVSRDGRVLWQYADPGGWGPYRIVDVGAGDDVSILEFATAGDGQVLLRLDASGNERWRRTIADRAFAESGKFTVSTSPSGRTLIAAKANETASLCGRRVLDPRVVGTNADGRASEGVVIGVNPDGSCAFVRVYNGAIHRSSVTGALFVDDDDVRILWDDALTTEDFGPSTQNLERIRWSTLVARYGVASP